GRRRDDEAREASFELGGARAGRGLALTLPGGSRQARGFLERRPRAGGHAAPFVALAQVHQGAEAGVELLAGRELRARGLVLALIEERLAFLEQRLRGGLVPGAGLRL